MNESQEIMQAVEQVSVINDHLLRSSFEFMDNGDLGHYDALRGASDACLKAIQSLRDACDAVEAVWPEG